MADSDECPHEWRAAVDKMGFIIDFYCVHCRKIVPSTEEV